MRHEQRIARRTCNSLVLQKRKSFCAVELSVPMIFVTPCKHVRQKKFASFSLIAIFNMVQHLFSEICFL